MRMKSAIDWPSHPIEQEGFEDVALGFVEYYFCGVPTVCLSAARRVISKAATPTQQHAEKDYGPTFYENEWPLRTSLDSGPNVTRHGHLIASVAFRPRKTPRKGLRKV